MGIARLPLRRFAQRRFSRDNVALALRQIARKFIDTVGVAHQRVGLHFVERCAFAQLAGLGRLERLLQDGLVAGVGLERRARLVQVAAGVVECGRRGAQHPRLAARIDARVLAVAPVELADRLGQFIQLGELLAIFFQLVHGLCHVGQQFIRQRRQCFGQRVRQIVFVGLFRQLRLA